MSVLPAFRSQKAHLFETLRRNGIVDERVLAALESIPREEFVMPTFLDQAWEDTALPIARGQTISQPFIVAYMTQALELSDRHKVLEIGTGSGYQACVLARICRRVYSIERQKPLLEQAEGMFSRLGIRNVTAICADGMKGWPRIHGKEQAPFDRIIVTAAARDKVPPALISQLSVGGVMIVPVGPPLDQKLRRYYKETEETYSYRDLMPVRFVDLLPDVVAGDSFSGHRSGGEPEIARALAQGGGGGK